MFCIISLLMINQAFARGYDIALYGKDPTPGHPDFLKFLLGDMTQEAFEGTKIFFSKFIEFRTASTRENEYTAHEARRLPRENT